MGWVLTKAARTSSGCSLMFMCFMLAIATPARAAEPQPAQAPHFSAEPHALYALASAPHVPSNSNVEVLEFTETYLFDADGSYTYTRYFLYKLLTGTDRNRWDTLSMPWSPWLDEKPVMKARVVQADGSVYTLDESTISDSPAHGENTLIYSDARLLRAPLPAIAPGAVVEAEITRRSKPQLAGAGVAIRSYARMGAPLMHYRLTLQAPHSVALRYRLDLLPGLQPKQTRDNDTDHWVFDSGPTPAADSPVTGLPGDIPEYPTITFSTGASWGELARAYSQIIEPRLTTAAVSALVARLTQGRKSREERIEALIDYLNREIRYTGIEFGQASVVPHTPAETLRHQYGDCKDKSLLLVAMLRAAGISANLALLSVGNRLDVPEDLPGMGLFDHAIVQVPGDPVIWIDATDENARLGELPDADHGRWALVVDPGTHALTRIAQARSADNVYDQNREIRLADQGPAHVTEVSRPRGSFEPTYRRRFADLTNTTTRATLTDYFKAQYLAERLDRLDRTDPKDFSQPWQLTLEGQSERAETALSDAFAYIPLGSLFDPLPPDLRTRDPTDEENAKATRPARRRTEDYQLNCPFVAQLHYRIVPPAGFEPASLPPDLSLKLGPAILEEHFSKETQGVVHADLRFDTVQRRFTAEELRALRNKVAELLHAQAIKIRFDLTAHRLLTQDHARESFQAYRELLAQHPNDAIQHLRRADGLLAAGMGEAARKEAQLATRLDPKSAFAQRTLAHILQHDLFGRWHAPGADFAAAAAAYRAAIALDPQNKTLIGDYAVLLEHDSEGVRYGPGADLKAAIAEYRQLTPRQLADTGLDANLAYALFYSRDFTGALQAIDPGNDRVLPLVIACNAELRGGTAALEEAHRLASSDERFKETLATAGRMVLGLRDYPNAAVLLENVTSETTPARSLALLSMLRQLRKDDALQLGNTPEDLVRRVMLAMLSGPTSIGTLTQQFESRNARLDRATFTPEDREHEQQSLRAYLNSMKGGGIPREVITDLAMQALQVKSSGDDRVGYREILQSPTGRNRVLFAVKEDGEYKILDTASKPGAVALEVLDRVQRNDLPGAAALLNWLREATPNDSGNDPYGGDPLVYVWTPGQREEDPHAIKVAAATVLAHNRRSAQRGVSLLEQEKERSSGATERDGIDLALLTGYNNLGDHKRALPIATALSERAPASRYVFAIRCDQLASLQRFQEADELAHKRLQDRPDDIAALRCLQMNSAAQHDYARAYERDLKVIASKDSDPQDLNELAWVSLFYDHPGGPDLASALRAAQQQPNDTNTLHTLACIYAELGRTREAREALLQAMELQNLTDPTPEFWYVFGRIAEAYGEKEIALTDYAKVTPPTDPTLESESTYRLAQAHARRLK